MKKLFFAALILFGIAANAQITQTAHFGIADTTAVMCKVDTAHALTIEFFVKNDDTTSASIHEVFYYLDNLLGYPNDEYIECFIQHNILTFDITDTLHTRIALTHTINSDWHHVAITMNNDSSALFVDGIKVDSEYGTFIHLDTILDYLFIGSINGASLFNGNITEFRISPAVLYASNFTDTCYYIGSYVYAPLNNYNDTSVIVNGTSISAHIPALTSVTPCAGSLAIAGIQYSDDIRISPNPVQNWIKITSALPLNNVRIRNMLGQTVYANRIDERYTNIDVGNLEAGVYILELSDNRSFKILKQ